MRKCSSGNAMSFCEEVLSSLAGRFRVFESYFLEGNPTRPEEVFDYKIIVVASWKFATPIPLHPISNVKELSALECLMLREAVKHIRWNESFVLGARFGPRVNRGDDGKVLTPFEILSVGDYHFAQYLVRHLVKDLVLASPHYPVFEGMGELPVWIPSFLRSFMPALCQDEALNDELFGDLTGQFANLFHEALYDAGLAKLLAIRELSRREQEQQVPLAREDASRVELLQDVVQPPYNTRLVFDPHSIGVHWAKMPARLFVYGPALDLVNALREKQMVKVCLNCGKLYRPYKHQRYLREPQHYCSRACKRTAERKRRYQRDKEGERTGDN